MKMLETKQKKRAKPKLMDEAPKQSRHPVAKPKRIQTAESWVRQIRAKRRSEIIS